MNFLPEICSSDYEHAPMVHLNKSYYSVGSTGHLLCDECLTSFVYHQSKLIAEAIYQQYQAAHQYKVDIFRDPNNTMEYTSMVHTLDYMSRILGPNFVIHTKIWTYAAIEQFDRPNVPSILGSSKISLRKKLGDDLLDFTYTVQLTDYAFHDEAVKIKYLTESIQGALRAFIRGTMDRLSEKTVECRMSAETQSKYSSYAQETGSATECPCHSDDSKDAEAFCAHCGQALSRPYYIYRNNAYCIDDMYAIVVEQAVASNLSEQIGLADDQDSKSSNYRIMETPEWKMIVIAKYFNVMAGFDRVRVMYPIE